MADRVVLFVDYQNAYHAARQAFAAPDPPPRSWGQFSPRLLGEHLVPNGQNGRELLEVRCYRGMPSATRDPRGHAAWEAQTAAWAREGVTTVSRPLWYPKGWSVAAPGGEKPREKGIDVALATDIVSMTYRQEFDVGIVMTLDTDLQPALEAVLAVRRETGHPKLEVAAWSVRARGGPRLALPGESLWCHWLDASVFDTIRDTTGYGK
jgi:uncharacterized LabA/DUF88 family protein